MADIHKYKFIMTGEAYNNGYDRIFKKRKNKNGVQQRPVPVDTPSTGRMAEDGADARVERDGRECIDG